MNNSKALTLKTLERIKETLDSGVSLSMCKIEEYKQLLKEAQKSSIQEYNQNLVSFDTLLDDSKEDLDLIEPVEESNIYHNLLESFLIKNLSPDEFLIYSIQLNPPPFFSERLKESGGKLTILHLIDFFEYERSRDSIKYFTSIRRNIAITLEKAKVELNI